MRFSLVLAVLGGAVVAPVAAQQFTRDAAAIPAQSIWTDGVTLADVDNDGDTDLVFANGSNYGGNGTQGSQPQHLFKNNGSGVFTAAHGSLNIANLNAKQVIDEDFDNDGDLDLFYCAGSLGFRPRLLLNNGGNQAGTPGTFADATVANVPNLSLKSFGIAAGDIDGDGDLDVCISDGGTFSGVAAQLRLLLNDGNAVFTDATAQLPVDLYNCQDITMFDYDGDFDIDIALSGKGQTNKRGRLYLNDGTGNFSISSAMNQVGGIGSTYEIEWGDLDGDGDFDGAVQSISGGSEGWARNNGPTTAMTKSTFPNPNGDDDNELAMVDYDNDGDLDVFVASLGGTEKIYRNDGGGTFVNQQGQIQSIGDPTLDFGFADLDGDDDYDMVTAQGEGGNFTNKIYDNNGGPDTLGPVIVADNGAANTAHLQVSDQVSDDGHVLVTVTATYTSNMGAGSMSVTPMGGGLFLAKAPSTPGLVVDGIEYTATDSVGNSTVHNVGTPPSPWSAVGAGKVGVNGVPSLVGSGTLVPTTVVSVLLDDAPTGVSSAAMLFVSTTSVPVPFKGGTLYANPFDVLAKFLNIPATGTLNLAAPWPAGIPSGFELNWQYAIQDFGIPAPTVSLSDAIKSTQP